MYFIYVCICNVYIYICMYVYIYILYISHVHHIYKHVYIIGQAKSGVKPIIHSEYKWRNLRNITWTVTIKESEMKTWNILTHFFAINFIVISSLLLLNYKIIGGKKAL